MLKFLNTKMFKFAAFAAGSQGMKVVQPVVVHRNGTSDLFGRFRRRH